MEIRVRAETTYGVTRVYPACRTSLLLAELAGSKTLTEHALKTIRALGYAVTEAPVIKPARPAWIYGE